MTTAALINPTEEQKHTLDRWRVSTFWVMLIGYIGYYIGRGNLAVALPSLSEKFGYTNSALGIILTSSELAYAFGKFTTGPLADKIGGKRIFLIGISGAIVFNLLFPMFPKKKPDALRPLPIPPQLFSRTAQEEWAFPEKERCNWPKSVTRRDL